jgi:hypothetical protein
MLYSQTNYLGSVLPIKDNHMCKWEDQIHKFVNGNLKLGKKKTFTSVKFGGLGLFPIKEFLQSQKLMDYPRGKKYRFGMERSLITLSYWQHVQI